MKICLHSNLAVLISLHFDEFFEIFFKILNSQEFEIFAILKSLPSKVWTIFAWYTYLIFIFSVFGLGTLIFTGLEIAMHATMEKNCVENILIAHPILQALFTFLQMHFLFVNSQVRSHLKHRKKTYFTHSIFSSCKWINLSGFIKGELYTVLKGKKQFKIPLIFRSSLNDLAWLPDSDLCI